MMHNRGRYIEPPPEGRIHFIASKDFENIDFFPNDSDFSNLQVYINGELTDQVANSITAVAGDDIKIVSLSKPYPFFYPSSAPSLETLKARKNAESDWLERLEKERDDLAEKTEKLRSFLTEVERDDEKRKCFDGWQTSSYEDAVRPHAGLPTDPKSSNRGHRMKHPDGFQILVAIDQLVNTFFGGYADETISSRSHRAYVSGKRKWTRNVINALFFWQKDHCKSAYESEIERAQLPPEMRDANE